MAPQAALPPRAAVAPRAAPAGHPFAELRDTAAVVGVGYHPFSKRSGLSPLAMAASAVLAAVEDAGLAPADLDGVATHHLNDSAGPHELAAALGLRGITWSHEELGGGSKAPALVGHAAAALHTGQATHVVVYRSLNGRSGHRMGGTGGGAPITRPDTLFQVPYGLVSPSQVYALSARMHMDRFGTTEEHLGQVALAQRCFAADNERAVMRGPLTMREYLSSRLVTEPLRLLDCCLETDGACALVLTTTPRARDLRHRPVTVRAWASAFGPDGFGHGAADLTTSSSALVARTLWARAGIGPADVDVAELYDAFTIAVLLQLEDYGFCGRGEAGPFVAGGVTAPGGRLPVNTHGGFLSEGYVHGINHIAEAVSQLRGDAGARQVPGCEVALSTAQPGFPTGISSAVLLRRQP
nr:lipid-transfer protein [Frankia sp. R43]